jgi:phosphohistidine phosphatase
MKTLLLLRHAKTNDAAAGEADFVRTLNERGRAEARAVGDFINERALSIDLVLCSSAARAKETAELVMTSAGHAPVVRYEQGMYEASSPQLFDLILNLDDDVDSVLLVGHNPGMEDLLHLLTDRVGQMATCTLAKVEIEATSWSDVAEVSGRLDWIVRPQDLMES